MMELIIHGYSGDYDVMPITVEPPKITDNLDTVCRTLEIKIQKTTDDVPELGKAVSFYFNSDLVFEGRILKHEVDAKGTVRYQAYDPLFYFKNADDEYVKNETANQVIKRLALKNDVYVGQLENTGAVFNRLYYQGKEAAKVAVDLLARTYKSNGRKYWYRYIPGKGLTLFQRKVPKELWAFFRGENLTDATISRSAENVKNVVKLVNRETGKTVVRTNNGLKTAYGKLVHFEETDKENQDTMEREGDRILKEKSQLETTMSIAAVNMGDMPVLYSGDVVYVQETQTAVLGAFYLKDVTHTFKSSKQIDFSASITFAPNIPSIQFDDATEDPSAKTETETVTFQASK
jgi:hypothetical protein